MFETLSAPIRAEMARRMSKEYDDASVKLYRESYRNHLGASVIGEPCDALNWFQFRWIANPNPGGRMYRLFQRGHREEPFVIAHYRLMGFTVNEVNPETGKQWRLVSHHGHFGGSCDGRGFLPTTYGYAAEVGYEIKTANTKQFKKLLNAGGVAKWKPRYSRQMDVYGNAWGLRYFVFITVNKDDDEKYFEIYECQPVEAERLDKKALRVISSRERPSRLSEHPAFEGCRYCDFLNQCHKSAMPDVNCRSCKLAVPGFNGTWHCEGYNATIPDDVIRVGCAAWKSII